MLRKLVQRKTRTLSLSLSLSLSGTLTFTTGVEAGETWITDRGVVDWVAKAESELMSKKMSPDSDAYIVPALALELGLGLHCGGQRRYCR